VEARWTGDLVISLHAIQSFGTGEAVHVRLCALQESSEELAEVSVLVGIDGRLNRRDAEEIYQDFGVFILAAFITDLLESFGKIVVVSDWVAFLMWH
jgi:hypothetical protein